MSNPDPNKIIFSSRYRYFLNKDPIIGSVAIASTSIPAGEYREYSMNIPISNQADFSQVKINFSQTANDWHVFPCLDVPLDANCGISVTGSYTTSSFEIKVYVVNQTPSNINSTAFTTTVRINPFEPPV